MVRHRFFYRTVSFCLLINFLASLLFPTVSLALTNGPTQPEYTSYESAGSTDLVNLMTGDFTYSLPLVNIPSPEGGFSMNLSYHSGIGPEQEASWVGLGWTLNAGAIVRDIIQFPDDAKGNMDSSEDVVTFNTEILGGYGWNKNYGVYHRNYDSEKGYGGALDIAGLVKTSWSKDGIGGSVIGLGVNQKGSFTFEAVEFMFGAFTVASMGVGGAFASVGELTKSLGVNMAASAAFAAAGSLKRPSSSSVNYGAWKMEYESKRNKKSYKYYIDSEREEEMYGLLYLGEMLNSTASHTYGCYHNGNPAGIVGYCDRTRIVEDGVPRHVHSFNATYWNTGIASDIMHTLEPGVYAWQHTQTNLAPDVYSVMGGGVSGLIQPYRLDAGSVAVSHDMDKAHRKYNMFPYSSSYKVPFRYPLEPSNQYHHHYGTEADKMGIDFRIGPPVPDMYSDIPSLEFVVTDNTIKHNSLDRTEGDRLGLKNNKLAGGKHIDWYSNSEILHNTDNIISSGKFIDYHETAVERTNFRTSRPQAGIGGFAITSVEGLTYHYSLPVYTRDSYNVAVKIPGPDRSAMHMNSPYAVTWLLTAITGPDFVDRGMIGVIDEDDFGYWVKFKYGLFSDSYRWEPGYGKLAPSAGKDHFYIYSGGTKETYYLDYIQTRSHVGLFVKNYRMDGKAYYEKLSKASSADLPSSSLRLDEIIILSKTDYDKIRSDYSVGIDGPGTTYMNQFVANGDDFSRVLDIYDISLSAREYINEKQIRKIKFNYDKNNDGVDDYDLCKGTVNSFYGANYPPTDGVLEYDPYTRGGKLTLHGLSMFGKNNNKLFADYKFGYSSYNPDYGNYSWDGWGMYSASGTVAKNTHAVFSSEGVAWNLNKITNPMGAELEIEYERDSYSSISGESIIKALSLSSLSSSEGGSMYLGRNTGTNKDLFIFKFDISQSGSVTNFLKADAQYDFLLGLLVFDCGSTPGMMHIPWPVKVLNIMDESSALVECFPLAPSGCMVTGINGKIKVEVPELFGGDVRVKRLISKGMIGETFNNYPYVYTLDGKLGGVSSGVVAQEPDFVSLYDYPFYGYYDMPATPVLYSKVTRANFAGKTEYNFIAPKADMISYHKTKFYDQEIGTSYYHSNGKEEELKMYRHDFEIRTAMVGKVTSVINYDKNDNLVNRTNFFYKNSLDNQQGMYTEASFLTERIMDDYFTMINRIFKTIKTFEPCVLDKIVTYSGESTNEVKYNSYDFLSSQVLETEYKNSLGIRYIQKSVPAYTKYTGMGSKTDDPSNKNMLMQLAAEYTYKESISDNSLVSASIQTWGRDDSYRAYDPLATHKYLDIPLGPNEKIWRKKVNYIWNSAFLNSDGTYQNFVDFDWTGANIDKRWQKTNEVTHYNVFSQPLETKDVNNDYASVQYDIANARPVASNTYGNMKSSTYSGFEYFEVKSDNTYHYEGEVISSINKGTVPQSIRPHTGSGLLMLNPETTAEFTTATNGVDNSQLKTGIRYKASVWIHEESASNAELGVILNGRVQDYPGTTYTPYTQQWVVNAQESVFTSGKWRLLSLEFEVPSYYSSSGSGTSFNGLKIYLKGGTGNNTYFDDLRFHPVVSNMTNLVYNDEDQIAYQIDGNNRYTRYEYDILGRVSAIYRETSKGEVKLKEYKYNFGRQ